MRARRAVEARVWEHIDRRSRCWLWTGPKNTHGYGRIATVKPKKEYVHRLMYQWAYGVEVGDGVVMHACDTPACVKPSHLHLGTQTENVRDMYAKGRQAKNARSPNRDKTHCSDGHEFTAENTYRDKSGWRRCRACHREYERARQQRLRGTT